MDKINQNRHGGGGAEEGWSVISSFFHFRLFICLFTLFIFIYLILLSVGIIVI